MDKPNDCLDGMMAAAGLIEMYKAVDDQPIQVPAPVPQKTNQRIMCEHKRQKIYCKDCHGSQICPHNKYKTHCRECGGRDFW
jgi:hypothetical protein